MTRLWLSLAAVALSLGGYVPGAAQNAKPRARQEPYDWHKYDNDPCGDPRAESNVWWSVTGKVVKVTAGDRLVIDMPKQRGQKAQRGVVVRLVGIEAPAPGESFGRESQQRLESLVLGRSVDVMTQMRLAYLNNLPGEIVGMAYLRSQRETLDLNMGQVRAGLARHKDAEPYTMSNYAQCRYRLTEGEARAAGRGLWRPSGVAR